MSLQPVQNPNRSLSIATAFVLALALLGLSTSASARPFERIRSAQPVAKIKAKVAERPRAGGVIKKAKEVLEEHVIDAVDQAIDLHHDLQRFKGPGCDPGQRSECSALKRRLKGIYTNLRGIADTLPGYEFLSPVAARVDPLGKMIDRMPPASRYGMSLVFGRLEILDELEMVSRWVDELHFYSIVPIEEDVFYRLGEEDCASLENAILADNEKFDRMQSLMTTTKTVARVAVDVLPKDIKLTIVGEGTAVPNPVLPVMVLAEQISSSFAEFLEKELETRGKLVKQCRAQFFREDVHHKLDTLLGW